MDTLDLNDLRLVKYIVEEGSLSTAAGKMYRSQSALSHKLKEMEKNIGFPMFTRRNRRLLLTEYGRVVFTYSTKILSQFDEMKNAIEDAKEHKRERIRLSTACYTSYHWLPSVIKRFKIDHPNVEIEIKPELSRNPLPFLAADQLDIAISDTRPVTSSMYGADVLFEDEFVLLVSKESKYVGMERVLPRDLDGADLITFDIPDALSTALNSYVNPLNIRLNSVTRMQLTEGIMEMVSANLGIAILPTWIAQPYVKRKQVIQLKLPKKSVKRKWYAVSHKNSTDSQKQLIKLFQIQLKETGT